MADKSTFVNVPAVADAEDEYDELVVLRRADNAVVANTVPPELAESTLQAFANLARIVQLFDSTA